MQDTLFDSRLVERDFGSHVLHVPQFLEWVKLQKLILPPSNPPIEDYKFAQVEALLCAIERACNSMTPQQALDVVMTMPELSAHRLHDADADDKYIERVGVSALRKKPPERDGTRIARWQPGERGDANFARWQLSAGAHAAWRKLITAGVRTQGLALLDFASKLPIAHSVAIACCDLVGEPGQVPAAEPRAETPKERRARWLEMFEHEQKFGKRGALSRLHKRECRQNPSLDRGNMGKAIKKAREERKPEQSAKTTAPAFTSRKIKGRYT